MTESLNRMPATVCGHGFALKYVLTCGKTDRTCKIHLYNNSPQSCVAEALSPTLHRYTDTDTQSPRNIWNLEALKCHFQKPVQHKWRFFIGNHATQYLKLPKRSSTSYGFCYSSMMIFLAGGQLPPLSPASYGHENICERGAKVGQNHNNNNNNNKRKHQKRHKTWRKLTCQGQLPGRASTPPITRIIDETPQPEKRR